MVTAMLNPGLRCEKPATNWPSRGTALDIVQWAERMIVRWRETFDKSGTYILRSWGYRHHADRLVNISVFEES
jgi:hypothetical protein